MPFIREKAHHVIVISLLWILVSILLFATQNTVYTGDTFAVVWLMGLLLFSDLIPYRWPRILLIVLFILMVLALTANIRAVLLAIPSGNFSDITAGARTIAFLGVIVFGARLLVDSIGRPAHLVTLILLGESLLLYLCIVYGFHDEMAVIAFFIVGFCLLILTNRSFIVVLTDYSWQQVMKWMFFPVGLIVFMALFGIGLSVASINWPPSLLWNSIRYHANPISKEAVYGIHDNHLGGNFDGSQAIDLTVLASQPSYYTGETLNTYTGTGWTSSGDQSIALQPGAVIPKLLLKEAGLASPTEGSAFHESVQVVTGFYPVLFGGYQVEKVMPPADSAKLTFNISTGTVSAGEIGPGTSYEVWTRQPDPSIQQLQLVRDGNLAYAFPQDLELPSHLPVRDILLAQRITKGHIGTYAKVQAIVSYLRRHETYQTVGIPQIRAGQDFVDQFLFVTHKGYCDHFSSALAVLARAVGIPTRWVTGFIAVPPDPEYRGTTNEYLLRGTDAHSWVEVWYASYGWLPVEATPSFVLPIAYTPYNYHVQHEQPPAVAATADSSRSRKKADKVKMGWTTAFLFSGLLFLIGVLALWMARFMKQRFVRPDRNVTDLLTQFEGLLGTREKQETLREFSVRTSNPMVQEDVLAFVCWYEAVCYGKAEPEASLTQGWALIYKLAHSINNLL